MDREFKLEVSLLPISKEKKLAIIEWARIAEALWLNHPAINKLKEESMNRVVNVLSGKEVKRDGLNYN